MAGSEKLLERFLSVPKDFTWEELLRVLTHFGYKRIKAGKTGGSRRKYADDKNNLILFHEPHPSNIVKRYVIRQVLLELKAKGHLKDE
jgi:hypothetical protein